MAKAFAVPEAWKNLGGDLMPKPTDDYFRELGREMEKAVKAGDTDALDDAIDLFETALAQRSPPTDSTALASPQESPGSHPVGFDASTLRIRRRDLNGRTGSRRRLRRLRGLARPFAWFLERARSTLRELFS